MNIDVVIVTHNSADHLNAVLGALPAGIDLIVVDNASTDASADIAERHGATTVRGTVNAGFGAACNRGASLGDAKVIVFLNPDAVIEADALARLVEVLDDPTIGVVSPRLVYPDGAPQQVRWPYPSAGGAWAEAFGAHRVLPQSADGFVVGACFAIRREAFEAAGGFDERFWLYGEEADLCRRVADLGWTVTYTPRATAVHVGGASGTQSDEAAALVAEHFLRGGEHFVAKHLGRRALVSYRLANLVGSSLRGGTGLGRRAAIHRGRARKLWHRLVYTPGTVALDSPATRAPGKGLVVCSLEAWDEVWRRNQFFVRELLAADPDLRVLFVEPAFDVRHERQRRSGRTHHKGLRPLEADGRVIRLEPVKWLPRRLGPIADRWRDRQVLRAVEALGFDQPRLWVNDPSYASLADTVDWPAVYDITDDWSLVTDPAVARAAQRDEARLFDRCEAITVCSSGLETTRRSQRSDLVVIPNAVDLEHLRRPRIRPNDLPAGPVAIYVGTLHTGRIDIELIAHLATEIPDLTVVLVGPDALDDESRRRLDATASVVRLGPRPYDQVPAYLQHADVIIVPHVVSAFTESLDPIKAYECLAVGTTTIATPVAGFRDQPTPIHVTDTEHFVDAVREAISEHPVLIHRDVPSWSTRATQFSEVLADASKRRASNPRSLRVAYFDHCAKLSGGELALARLIPALTDVEPTVILGEPGPLEAVLAASHIPTEVLPMGGRLNGFSKDAVGIKALDLSIATATLRTIVHLRSTLRRLDPDLLHVNSLKSGLLGSIAGRSVGVPVIWHVHDRISPDYLPKPAVALIRAALRILPNAVIANSEATRSTLVGVPNVTVIGNAFSAVDEAPTSPVVKAADAPLRVVMVGRLAPWKGQKVFLKAFAQAFSGSTTEAVIAGTALFGEESYVEELHKLTADLGLTDQVTLVGHVDDVPSLLLSADIVVHASTIPEPFGQVVVEAMALGRSVIAANAGGPAEIITDGVDGMLVPPADVDALAKQLLHLSKSERLRNQLGMAAVSTAARFAPDLVATDVADLYRQATTPAHQSRPRRLPHTSAHSVARLEESHDHPRPSAKRRVVFFDHCAQLSGGELAMARLLPALDDIDATVILGEQGPLVALLEEGGQAVEILELDADLAHTTRFDVNAGGIDAHTFGASMNAIWRLQKRLRELQPDLLHTNSLKANLLGGIAGRLAGIPVVWHVRDRMATDYLPLSAIRLVRAASRILPSAIIANSEATKVALGISSATVIASPVEVPPRRSESRVLDDQFDVAMVGRLAPWKGQDVFLRAFARAFPDGNARAVIAGSAMFGEDVFADSLVALTNDLGISERVDFLGFVDDVSALLSGFDVLVHASVVPEPFGQVVVEGMAAALPVIATNVGGPSEVITDEIDGLLVPPGNIELLAADLQRLARDQELRRCLGEAAHIRARDFAPEIIADKVQSVYRLL